MSLLQFFSRGFCFDEANLSTEWPVFRGRLVADAGTWMGNATSITRTPSVLRFEDARLEEEHVLANSSVIRKLLTAFAPFPFEFTLSNLKASVWDLKHCRKAAGKLRYGINSFCLHGKTLRWGI